MSPDVQHHAVRVLYKEASYAPGFVSERVDNAQTSSPRCRRSAPATWAAGILAVLPAILHLAVEGYRWQILPAYLLAAMLTLLVAIRLRSPLSLRTPGQQGRRAKVAVVAGTIFGLLLLGTSGFAIWLFPVFELPEPTGPYPIGITRLHLVDESRAERFSDDPAARRDVMVQVWYPAEAVEEAERTPYLYGSEAKTRLFLGSLGLPSFLLDHFSEIEGHASFDVPVSTSEPAYPVLIFSHGYAGILDQNVVQMEELASHGYVVASIGHTYESLAVLFSDGRVVSTDADHFDAVTSEAQETVAAWQAAETVEERISRAMHMFRSPTRYRQSARLWAEDISFVLDELEGRDRLGEQSPFDEEMDLSRIGVFGHSLGGAAAGQSCLVDSRVTACLNMDGPQWGDMVDHPVQRPIMFMVAEDHVGWNDDIYRAAQCPAYYVTIEGAAHLDFSDQPLWSPIMQINGMAGPIGAQRALEVVNAYSLAFFDGHIRGWEAPPLDTPSPDFPEVHVAAMNQEICGLHGLSSGELPKTCARSLLKVALGMSQRSNRLLSDRPVRPVTEMREEPGRFVRYRAHLGGVALERGVPVPVCYYCVGIQGKRDAANVQRCLEGAHSF